MNSFEGYSVEIARMSIHGGTSGIKAIPLIAPVYFGKAHNSDMNAKERARLRFVAWWNAQKEAGDTQTKLAKRLGVSQPTVGALLTKGPMIDHLDMLADETGITPSQFVADVSVAIQPKTTKCERHFLSLLRQLDPATKAIVMGFLEHATKRG